MNVTKMKMKAVVRFGQQRCSTFLTWLLITSFCVVSGLSFTALRQSIRSPNTIRNGYSYRHVANNFLCQQKERKCIHTNTLRSSTSTSLNGWAPEFLSAYAFRHFNNDAISVATAFVILCGYHFQIILREKAGKKTWRSVQADTRERWSRYVRETEGWLYAIQTMRNAITSMTFLATTVLSLLTVISGRLWEVIRNLDPTKSSVNRRGLWIVQFAVVASCMLTSAYHFLQSARLMTHAGFMFPVERKGTTKVDSILRKSQNAQWLGLRWLYISLGVISWIVGGANVFLVAAVLLCIFFVSIDKVPEGLGSDQL